jgi:hypothetical protein
MHVAVQTAHAPTRGYHDQSYPFRRREKRTGNRNQSLPEGRVRSPQHPRRDVVAALKALTAESYALLLARATGAADVA